MNVLRPGFLCSTHKSPFLLPRVRTAPLCAALLLRLALCGQSIAQQNSTPITTSGGGVAASAPSPFRMLSAVSGTKSVEANGKFIIQDPRAQFHAGEDHKIIVYFNWSGPIGPHNFEALWKDPSGKVIVVSDFKYEAHVSPFSGYWSMLLDDQAATGFWSVEAHIDGQFAGNYSFEVVSGPLTVTVPKVPIPATPAEIYRQAEASTVTVESLGPSAKPLHRATGFFVSPDRIATTFSAIDGATSLRITPAGGVTITSEQIAGWNRWQDWALIAVPPQQIAALKSASKPAEIGQQCYTLGVSTSGGRTISQEAVVGESNEAPAGARLTLALAHNSVAAGSPVLDEFGNVLGMLGGDLLPGISSSTGWSSGVPIPAAALPSSAFVVPISLIGSSSAPLTLADLAAKGQFIPALDQGKVLFGVISTQMIKQGAISTPREMEAQFSKGDKELYLMVHWNSDDNLKGMAYARFYDLNNQMLEESKPTKVNVGPNSTGITTMWTVPMSAFPLAMYRVDVDFGDTPVWREFFRVTP